MATRKKTVKKSAERKKREHRPRNWDKAVNLAYLRMVGYPRMTQETAAKRAGVSVRTLRDWENAPFWAAAKAEARDRWFNDGDAAAMQGILDGMTDPNESAQMSRWWAERHIPELAPPKQKSEITGANGGPIAVQDLSKLSDEELDLAERIALKIAVDGGTNQE